MVKPGFSFCLTFLSEATILNTPTSTNPSLFRTLTIPKTSRNCSEGIFRCLPFIKLFFPKYALIPAILRAVGPYLEVLGTVPTQPKSKITGFAPLAI